MSSVACVAVRCGDLERCSLNDSHQEPEDVCTEGGEGYDDTYRDDSPVKCRRNRFRRCREGRHVMRDEENEGRFDAENGQPMTEGENRDNVRPNPWLRSLSIHSTHARHLCSEHPELSGSSSRIGA